MTSDSTPSPPSAPERGLSPARLLWMLATLAPALALVSALFMWFVDVPYHDEFAEVSNVATSFSGALTFADLWASHSEHRPVFPRLLVIANAHLTGWNTCYEAALQVLLVAAVLALLLFQVARTWRPTGQPSPLWLPAFFSLALFSLGQWENWFWGACLSMTLCVFTAVAALFLLCSPRLHWPRLLAALALALVSTYSLGPGVAVWPVALAPLLLQVRSDRRYLTQALPVWLAVAIANYLAYTHGLPQIQGNNSVTIALAHPGEFFTYVTCYLGAPLWYWLNPGAEFFGVLGLLATPALAWHLHRRRAVPLPALLPWLTLYLFAVAGAVLTCLGRLQTGVYEGLSSRYLNIPTLLWVSAAALLALTLTLATAPPLPRRERTPLLAAGALIFLLLSAFLIGASEHALYWIKFRSLELTVAAQALYDNDPENVGDWFGPPEMRASGRAFLQDHHLSVFRPGAAPVASGNPSPTPPPA